jgi:hypothetical protein
MGFQPDGRRWVSYGASEKDGSALKFWGADDGEALAAWAGPKAEPSAIAISPEGRLAVVGARAQPLQYWGLPDEKSVAPSTPLVKETAAPPTAAVGNAQRILLFDPAEWPEVKTRKKGSEVISEVGGPWAETWRTSAWDKAAIAEFTVERVTDGKALTLCNIQGRASAQISVGKPLTTLKKGHRYQVAVVYQVDEGATGSVHVRKDWGHPGNVHMMDLRSTFGQWREAALVFTQAEDAPLLLFLQNYSVGADKKVLFRRIEITEQPVKTDDRNVIHRLNFGQPFLIRKQGDQTLEKTGTGTWPQGWVGNIWKETSVGVFALEPVGDVSALKLETVEGEPAMQLFTPSAPVQLVGGRRYAVKLTYQAAANLRGNLGLREEEGTTDRIGLQLLPTGDEWRTTEVVFQPPRNCPLKLYIQNRSTPPDGALRIRSLEVAEVK